MSEISKCYTGEVDILLHSEFITNSSSDHSMLRGAQVQKYYITNDISQGDILFLKADGYLDKNKGEKSQHHNTSIGGGAGVYESDQITGRIIALAAADVSPFPGNRQLQLVAEAVLQGLEVNGAFGQVIVGDRHA